MCAIDKNIDIIHNCEERFYNWLKSRLIDHGIKLHDENNLSGLLEHYEAELSSFKQHLKPLLKWNRIKDECYNMNERMNGRAKSDEFLNNLVEKTAFEGQILWLTFQEE